MREEIKKMGDEGVRLLDTRERELSEMRSHLKTMLKVTDQRAKSKTFSSSYIAINRPPQVKPEEPLLVPAAKKSTTKKPLKNKTPRNTPTTTKKKAKKLW